MAHGSAGLPIRKWRRCARLVDAVDVAAQKKITEQMQVEFWQSPAYAPLGMYDQPTAFANYLTDIRDGWPQFYGVKKNV